MLDQKLKQKIIIAQRNELTEHIIYDKLAKALRDKERAKILEEISQEELSHHNIWKEVSQESVTPDKIKIFLYLFISKIFGLTFGLKLMERGEDLAQDTYAQVRSISTRVDQIIREEGEHEASLIDLIDEERLKYISSVVLGLNDALVELTGALVGFSLALQNARLVGIVGLITGIAASLSMAASEYLSTKQEDTGKNPIKASIYTGFAYVGTVILLILPYLLFENIFICLTLVVMAAMVVIYIFTYYISVAKELDFKKRFLEMAGISLGVAAINFVIGLAVRKIFGIEV